MHEQNQLLLQNERETDQNTILRLQSLIDSMQETGESQASHLEAELLERSRDCAVLRRDAEERGRQVEELLKRQEETREAAETSRTLKEEAETLRQKLAASDEEKRSLNAVVDRCVEKLEKDSRERPHLVDKRMVTQMIASFLEQRDNPANAFEIMSKMADLLGFTAAEREQVGLAYGRKSLMTRMEEPSNLAELSDRFMDFLLEESED